uniref:RNA polymerase II subunit 5-mediating protein homolog n=1 Tax=Rhizophora mucronata TaxID=61149 RepID=A0A2P2LS64_RHIMU
MEEAGKGTVTPFASMFPADEAQKAAKRVEEEIAEKEKELGRLKEFIADNTNLINLVSKLPDELHHNIMVPFGKAAFFPGRLIHTNEFMVLLGEGYYAERTSKQTIEILKRRGKVLNSQVESLKANMKDLEAEASFFDATASEAAEGLVEIREDYVEENSNQGGSKSDDRNATFEDDEYARIMSRLDELEKEELAAEGDDNSDKEEPSNTAETDDEKEKEEEIDEAESENDSDSPDKTFSQIRKPQEQMKNGETKAEVLSNKHQFQPNFTDQLTCTGLTVEPVHKGIAV